MIGLSLPIIRLRLPCWTMQPHFLAVEVRKIMRRCRLIFLNSNSSGPFLCIEFFGRPPVGWAIRTVDTLAKDQSKVGVFQPTHTNLSNPTLANMVSRKGDRPVVAGAAAHTNHRRGKSSSCVLIPRFAGFNFCFMFVTSFFRVYWFLFRNCNFS